jgi:hypothetical protein
MYCPYKEGKCTSSGCFHGRDIIRCSRLVQSERATAPKVEMHITTESDKLPIKVGDTLTITVSGFKITIEKQ